MRIGIKSEVISGELFLVGLEFHSNGVWFGKVEIANEAFPTQFCVPVVPKAILKILQGYFESQSVVEDLPQSIPESSVIKEKEVQPQDSLSRSRFTKQQKELFDKYCEVQPIKNAKKRTDAELLERMKVRQALLEGKIDWVQSLINKYQEFRCASQLQKPDELPIQDKATCKEDVEKEEVEEAESVSKKKIEDVFVNEEKEEEISLEFSEFEESEVK